MSCKAGGQLFVVAEMEINEEVTVGFPINTWLEWIQIGYTFDSSEVWEGLNYRTRVEEDFQSTFHVNLEMESATI